MTKEELEKEAEKKYCNCCKWRIEQCLWAWRNTNGLKEPNEKNCSCKEVPAYLAGAESREKRIADLEAKIKHLTKHLEPQAMSALFEQVEEEVKQEQRIKELEAQIEKMKLELKQNERIINTQHRVLQIEGKEIKEND